MASKRTASSPKRASKKSRTTKLISTVIDALADADVLPGDLRTLLSNTLPSVMDMNKADRTGFDIEVVKQAEQALGAVQAAIVQEHANVLAKQNEVIAPSEHARRQSAVKEATVALEAAKANLEACKETRNTAQKVVNDAQAASKTAEKEGKAAEKQVQAFAAKKVTLSDLLANEFALLRDGTSAGAAGKKAVQKLLAVGKEFHLDSTLLEAFPLTCKKEAASRTEFEGAMFTSMQNGIAEQITKHEEKIGEGEQAALQKQAAVAAAKDALEKAEAGLTAANEGLTATQEAQKEANQQLKKADAASHAIWEDMKAACDAQDSLAKDLDTFKESVWVAFNQLKEKEPEPEKVEAPEPMEEQATTEAVVELPVDMAMA